jgi:SAM-dependent methyltransferase
VADSQHLPFANQSVDAILLAHSLELAANPHALLREVDRVLCTRGQLIVLGFNPMSLWHIQHHLPARWRGAFPAQSRFYTSGRVRDWLGLLDFEIEGFSRFGGVLPWMGDISRYHGLQRWLAVFSQAYMIFARKRVVPLTPKRRSWRAITDLGHAVLPEARVQRGATDSTKS